jgi:hypothetical protein
MLPENKKMGIFIDATAKDDVKMLVATRVGDKVQVVLESKWDGHKVDGKISAALTW